MDSNLLHNVALGWMFSMVLWGTISFAATVIDYLEEWRRAHRSLNTEVPALAASVKELQARQLRLETELGRVTAGSPRT
jgi:hypothetical protein